MTLVEHLTELRTRLIRSLVGLLVAGVVSWFFFHPMFSWLTRPYCRLPVAHRFGGHSCDLIVTGVLDPFTVRLRIATYMAIVLSSPVWLYQLWRFVTPALHRHERRWGFSFVGCSMVLFALGGFFAYLTISNGLRFLLGLAGEQFTPLIQVNSYLSFLMAMLLVFGLSFEFPLLVVLLNLAGVVSAKRLRRWRRMVIFCVFAFAAVATPTQDPITMLVMAVPICLLYEVAVVVARTHDRRVAKREMESAYHLLPDEQPSPLEMGSA